MAENKVLLPFSVEQPKTQSSARRKFMITGAFVVLVVMVVLGTVVAYSEPLFSTQEDDSSEEFSGLLRYEVPDMYCNDGTPAVYFVRQSTDPDEHRWVIRFEGGGNCASEDACEERWATRPSDMTTIWDEEIWEDEEAGILCADPKANPIFYNWNHVYAHYCSSDSWLGTLPLDDPENELDWHFNGYNIMYGILDELVENHGITDASHIITFGLSVGGTMMYNTVDRFVDFWDEHVPEAATLFTADAGWMLYDWNYGISDMGTQGEWQFEVHRAAVDPKCLAANYTWECYYPSEFQFQFIENTDKLLVLNAMFDKMAMGLPLGDTTTWSDDQFNWAMDRAEYVVEGTTSQAHHLFLSNCRNHDSTDKIDFVDVTVDGLNIEHAVYELVLSEGKDVTWKVDEVIYPEENPTCPFDQLEWNKIHCGDFDISDCEDETSTPDTSA